MKNKKINFCHHLKKQLPCEELFGCDLCPHEWGKKFEEYVSGGMSPSQALKKILEKSIPHYRGKIILEDAIGERLEVIQRRKKEGSL